MKHLVLSLFIAVGVFAQSCCDPDLERAVALLIQKVQRLEMLLQKRQEVLQESLVESRETSSGCSLKRSERFFYLEPGRYAPIRRVNIRSCPNRNGTVLGMLEKGSVVQIKGCNRYGWCLLEDGGYVAGYLLKKVRR